MAESQTSSVYLLAVLAIIPLLIYQVFNYLHPLIHKLTVMKISEIYVYPIKSLRGVQLSEAVATKHGFKYDRRFMLLEVTPNGYTNMAVSRYPEMTQFLTGIETDGNNGSISVKFRAFGDATKAKSIKIPLEPCTEKLEPFDVNMHGSPTKAHKMPTEYSQWFSSCFGYEVLFVYLGEHRRDVLFADLVPEKYSPLGAKLMAKFPILDRFALEKPRITFADCAPYLIVSKTSLTDVSSRLPDGQEMDVTKFRPNIVVEGASEPWQEDFWGRIKINNRAEIIMAHNCVRCKSINIDYETGQPGTGESGQVLKKLQKDRRVDIGAKWSPVFGRYSYWDPKFPTQKFKVGDEVRVVKVNEGRTVWSKPAPR